MAIWCRSSAGLRAENGGTVATVIGQSGAWHAIVADIAARGHTIASPQDLEPLLAFLRTTRQGTIDTHRAYTMRSVAERSARIAQLKAEPGLIRRFLNGFKIASLRQQVEALYSTDARYPALLDRTIHRVEALPNSAELAGAVAELAIIDRLRSLPPSFAVFNDVRLRANRHIYFDGAALQSAQLDHVVVGPNGVFAIETKHWSRQFADSGDYHDPFDQTRRANYLCYDLLRAAFGKTSVHSLIVCLGSLPQPPDGTHVKVLRPTELCGYISGFRKAEFGPERLEQVRAFFAQRVAGR